MVDGREGFDVIYLDFAQAFDKVPRERLLNKVRAHGIRGRVLGWIRGWLTGRRQRVVLNGKFSSWEDVLSGVPQGSVLGPLLFLIFVNDMDDTVEHLVSILRKFADDTKLGKKVMTEMERQELQEALDRLCEWASMWGMQFNVSKCKVMHMGHANPKFSYSMNGQELEETEEERDIGVVISSNMKPTAQCAEAARSKDCPGCSCTNNTGIPLQRQACFHETLQAVCTAPPGILHSGMGSMDLSGQGMPGKSATESSETGVRASQHIL